MARATDRSNRTVFIQEFLSASEKQAAVRHDAHGGPKVENRTRPSHDGRENAELFVDGGDDVLAGQQIEGRIDVQRQSPQVASELMDQERRR